MSPQSKVVVFIPVRGGSKSIPLKNIRNLGGQPMLCWSLQAAVNSPEVDEVVVATDHDEIEKVVQGLPSKKIQIYRRKQENAQDSSGTESVMLEYLQAHPRNEKDLFVLVQATNPFLTSADLSQGIQQVRSGSCDSLLSVVRSRRFFWNLAGTPVNYDYRKRPRRQDFDGWMMENGSFYINSVAGVLKDQNRLSGKVGFVEMSEESGFEIDEPADWIIVEGLLAKKTHRRDFSRLKLFLTDVDGVLTDAGMYYSEAGDELKKFNTLDGMGMQMLMKTGIQVGIVTGENTKLVARRAEKLKINILHQGIKDKLTTVKGICSDLGIGLDQVAFIGDDINDLEILKSVGYAACPATAVSVIRAVPGILQMQKSGGEGVVREFIEMILQGKS